MPSPYDILFEPVRIGPVTAPTVLSSPSLQRIRPPHATRTGGHARIKAEGGWGVVCTEEMEIHHSSDLSPYFEAACGATMISRHWR